MWAFSFSLRVMKDLAFRLGLSCTSVLYGCGIIPLARRIPALSWLHKNEAGGKGHG